MKNGHALVEVPLLVPEERLAEFYTLMGRWYDAGSTPQAAPQPSTKRGRPSGSGRRYLPLAERLAGTSDARLELSFTQIDELLGSSLPESARKFRTFWANSSTPQGRAWQSVGWRVVATDFDAQKVTFAKA